MTSEKISRNSVEKIRVMKKNSEESKKNTNYLYDSDHFILFLNQIT